MATIDRDKLYNDVIFWLPDEQALSESEIRTINDLIISKVGDDTTNYPEILCKSLEANARKNQINYTNSTGNIKSEKVDQVQLTYFEEGEEDIWDKYIESLSQICPLFGYNKPYPIGMKINVGTKPKVTDCPDNCLDTDQTFFVNCGED